MSKQIIEQLELPLECIYQLALSLDKKTKVIKKVVTRIPAYSQMILDFSTHERAAKRLEKVKAHLMAGSIGIIGAIAALNYFLTSS